jgi:hypothetical protein
MPTKEEVLEFIADCQAEVMSEFEKSDLHATNPYYGKQVAPHMIALGKLEQELLGEIKTMVKQLPVPLNFLKKVAEMHKTCAISAIRSYAWLKKHNYSLIEER